MLFSKNPLLIILIGVFLVSEAAFSTAFGQAIIKEREWTNAEGKKLKAELLRFGRDSRKHLVTMRARDGRVYQIKPETLSRPDQALILKARFDRQFRSRYSERLDAHFFYSEIIPKKEEHENTVAYIGNDSESAWLRARFSLPSALADKGAAIMIVGTGAEPIRLPYSVDDMDRKQGRSIVDLSLTKKASDFETLLQKPDRLKFVVESRNRTFSELPVSKRELEALMEVSRAFQTLNSLLPNHIWWATFQDLDLDLYIRAKEEESARKAEEEAKKAAMTAPSKLAPSGPVSEPRTWTLEDGGESFLAEISRFERHRVVFKLNEDENRVVDLVDLAPGDRETIGTLRMEYSLSQNWHPHDDQFSWYWPKQWTGYDERLGKQAILFAINRETGEPKLFVQQRLKQENGVISKYRLQAPEVSLDMEILVDPGALKLRSPGITHGWVAIPKDLTEIILIASPALEGFKYEINAGEGSAQKGAFSSEEFAASIEAIEIFRAWNSVLSREKADFDPLAQPAP